MRRFRPLSRDAEIPALPGYYVIKSKECISHIGTGKNLRSRIKTLISLRHHRGSAEVLCVAYCTKSPPVFSYRVTENVDLAETYESRLKTKLGEPPCPREGNQNCVNGKKLREDLVSAVGPCSRDAGYIEAVFDIGEDLYRVVCNPKFDYLWQRLGGKPPGPWCVAREVTNPESHAPQITQTTPDPE